MTLRLQGQNCKYLTTPLSHNSQRRPKHKDDQTKYRNMTRKPRSHVRTLMNQTRAIAGRSRPLSLFREGFLCLIAMAPWRSVWWCYFRRIVPLNCACCDFITSPYYVKDCYRTQLGTRGEYLGSWSSPCFTEFCIVKVSTQTFLMILSSSFLEQTSRCFGYSFFVSNFALIFGILYTKWDDVCCLNKVNF